MQIVSRITASDDRHLKRTAAGKGDVIRPARAAELMAIVLVVPLLWIINVGQRYEASPVPRRSKKCEMHSRTSIMNACYYFKNGGPPRATF